MSLHPLDRHHASDRQTVTGILHRALECNPTYRRTWLRAGWRSVVVLTGPHSMFVDLTQTHILRGTAPTEWV